MFEVEISDVLNEFKAKKGKQEISFFSIPEFKEWKAKIDEKGEKGWQYKYYKVNMLTALECTETVERVWVPAWVLKPRNIFTLLTIIR